MPSEPCVTVQETEPPSTICRRLNLQFDVPHLAQPSDIEFQLGAALVMGMGLLCLKTVLRFTGID